MVNRMTISLRSYGTAERSSGNHELATQGSDRKCSETSATTGPTLTDVFSTFFGAVDRSVIAGFTDAYELDTRMATSDRKDGRLPQ